MSPHRLLVDCDPALFVPGLDVDDDLALLFLLGSSEVELIGVTTTAGNTPGSLAFHDAKKLISLAGRQDIPVKKGAGFFARDVRPTEASRFLLDVVRRFPGEITLLALGPLTNVAAAAAEDGLFERNLRELVVMGGRTASGKSDFNFRRDPRSAASVLRFACPKAVIAFDLGLTVAITGRDLRSLLPSKHGLLTKLSRFARFQDFFRSLRGREEGEVSGGFHPWDVVAAAFLVKPELLRDVHTRQMSVDAKGRTVFDAAGAGGEVSMPASLDGAGFRELFFERIGRALLRA